MNKNKSKTSNKLFLFILIVLIIIICVLYYKYVYNIENFSNKNNNKNIKNDSNKNTITLNNENIGKNINNIFLYWVGNDYKLIKILRDIIYLHSNNGKNYTVHLINKDNIKNYIKTIPDYFNDLLPAHQADFIRVNVICDYGGIWLDSDTLVMDDLTRLFNIINNKDGFFMLENNEILFNGVFGSKPNTPLMIEWKTKLLTILDTKKQTINWTEIGNSLLENIKNNNPEYYNNYKLFNGLDNMYPVNWNNCVDEFITKPYDNYKTIEKDFQPLIVLVNSVYKKLETDINNEKDILAGNLPLNYFINKSITNIK